MRGNLDAVEYHTKIVSLGLLPLVADLAALCPDAQRREQLMAAHMAYLTSEAAQARATWWMLHANRVFCSSNVQIVATNACVAGALGATILFSQVGLRGCAATAVALRPLYPAAHLHVPR